MAHLLANPKIKFKMKKLLLVISIVTIGFSANAQSSEKNILSINSIYFDTGIIPGVHGFVNYDEVYIKEKEYLGLVEQDLELAVCFCLKVALED